MVSNSPFATSTSVDQNHKKIMSWAHASLPDPCTYAPDLGNQASQIPLEPGPSVDVADGALLKFNFQSDQLCERGQGLKQMHGEHRNDYV